jgi:Fic family protein
MTAFLQWYNEGCSRDAVLKSVIVPLWLVTIHPFADGNGCIARAIADMSLARSEDTAQCFYSMATQIRPGRAICYKKLEQTPRGDLHITDWLAWFFGCLERAFTGAEESFAVVLAKAELLTKRTDFNLNQRRAALASLENSQTELGVRPDGP